MSNTITVGIIATKIFELRGKKVMLDRDLAQLYEVTTRRLNEQVKRNIKRFPEDFMLQLTKTEKDELVAICDRFNSMKHSTVLPYAFTQEGVAMLSSVLNSDRAIQVNIQVMRAFVQLRFILSASKQFEVKLKELENWLRMHDKDIGDIFEAIRQLIGIPNEKRRIKGFMQR